MPPRRNGRTDSLESVLAALPARFREVELHPDDGAMAALRAYTSDLSDHLRRELGLRPADEPRATARDVPPTIEVMTALGIPPAEWYRALLTTNHEGENNR